MHKTFATGLCNKRLRIAQSRLGIGLVTADNRFFNLADGAAHPAALVTIALCAAGNFAHHFLG